MKVNEINKYINLLVGNLSFTMDYNNLCKGTKHLLIVEGQTDKKFIEKILCDDIVCMVANKAFGVKKGFSPQETINCKNAIMEVVNGMSKIPITFLKVPKYFENFKIFGMIDLDYDNSDGECLSSRLFVTDTHDLETLLISTDNNILQHLNGCFISTEDANTAFYLSYQLGFLRKFIKKVINSNKIEFDLQPICAGTGKDIDYFCFIENYKINVKKLINYLNKKNNNCLSTKKENEIIKKVLSEKEVNKKLDKNGNWNSTLEEFKPLNFEDFWTIVNGHDLLSILKFINNNAKEKYNNKNSYSLNRDFEMDLIDSYEYTNIKKTEIYKNMRKENVVKSM